MYKADCVTLCALMREAEYALCVPYPAVPVHITSVYFLYYNKYYRIF